VPIRRRRQLPSPAYAEVHAILERPWLVDVGLLEGIANDVHERTDLLDPFARGSGQILAAHLGYLVMPRVLLVRSSADDLRWNLRVLHELAHALLDEECAQHSHADVWALTLALAIPRRRFRQHQEARHVPRWAVALRRLTARVVARAA
jgi:hypothetical protein